MAVERSGRGPRVHCAMTIFALLVVAGCSRDEAHSEGPMSPSRTGTREAKPAEPVEARPDAILELGDPELLHFIGDLDEMRARRVVRALVAPSRTDFFLDHGQIRGIQAELLREFAEFLNADGRRESERIRVKFVPVAFGELIPALQAGKGDLAAAFLTETPRRNTLVQFVPGMREQVSEVIVTHRSVEAPSNAEALSGQHVYVLHESSYADHLRELNERLHSKGLAPVEIEQADPRIESEDILELVNSGVVSTTIVDDYKARLWARVLPNIRVHEQVAIATGRTVGWAVRHGSTQLASELARFTSGTRSGTLLGNILFERYFKNVRWVDDPTARAERDKLERYIALFEKYAEKYGFEPLALAAQGYQESRLDHSLRSQRGAIGLMQLLPSTARDPNVGIPDIHSVDANIHAGAKYMAFLRDRYFSAPEIDPWNRTALSLAAYNAGPRKIREARAEATRMGLDPNVWFDNVEIATGRRVGREPVRYVANIYKYYVAYRLVLGRTAERQRIVAQ